MRTAVKGVAERLIIWSGAARLQRRRMSGRVLVLAYHNIVPDGLPPIGDAPNHLPLSSFGAQLDELGATHEIIPLADVLQPADPRSSKPRAAITFDDAYRGAVTHGVSELVRRRLPATIFVTPAFIGGRSFWWDALARDGVLDQSVREHALNELRGEDAHVRAWASGEGRQVSVVPDVACAASEAELLRAASSPGITLGSHTWGHPSLPSVSPEELAAELTRPLAWLRERIANPLSWLAYPYGHYNEAVARAARDAGYEAGLAISGGWLARRPPSRFELPRINIPPGLSARGFVLRGAGLLTG